MQQENTRHPSKQGRDVFVALIIGFATMISRWPFQATFLDGFDAVNYALALDHLDIRLYQPQPPGYPLYILLGRCLYWILHDHRAALVWLSTICSGLAVIAIFLLGRAMFGRRVGLIAALLTATLPSVWLYGELAAPYTADLLFATLAGWACYRAANSKDWIVPLLAAVALGLAGSLRPQTMVFLLPLFLYSIRRQYGLVMIGALVAAGAIFSIFFAPAVMDSGGLSLYLQSLGGLVEYTKLSNAPASRSAGLARNVYTVLRTTFVTLNEWNWPFVALGWLSRPNNVRFWRNPHFTFFILWIAPAWLVFTLIWPGNPGTMLVFMPPLFLLAAAGFDWLIGQARLSRVGWAALAIVIVGQIVLFILPTEHPFGAGYRRFDTRQTVVWRSNYYQAKLGLVGELPVEGTVIYTTEIRHLQYYLPQYRTFSLPYFSPNDPSRVKDIAAIENNQLKSLHDVEVDSIVPPDTRRIVLIDPWVKVTGLDGPWIETRSRGEYAIRVVTLPPLHRFRWTAEGLTVVEQAF